MTPLITAVTAQPVTWPMRQPFITAGGTKTTTQNLWVTVTLSRGISGVGEASESLAWPEDSQQAMQRCVTQVTRRLVGTPCRKAWRILRAMREAPWARAPALAAVECALVTAEAHELGLPPWRYAARQLGVRRARPIRLRTSLTISAWPPQMAEEAARRAAAQGFCRLKVKVTGHNPEEDLARILAVHRAARGTILWVDANQGFSVKGALAFLRAIEILRLPVALFEQPVSHEDLEGLASVQRQATIPIAADEAVRTPQDAERLIARRAARVMTLKLAKSGWPGTLEIIRMARRAGIDLMISCMAESARGLAPSVHLACGTGAFRYVDLDSHLLVAAPRQSAGFRTHGPYLISEPP